MTSFRNLVTLSSTPSAEPAGVPGGFHLLAKPTGAVCNLDCDYCFFLSKEMLYPGSRFRMADELLETCIRQLIEAHARVPVVQVAWQGGEPTLMGLKFFRRSVELVNRYLRPGQTAEYTIQTNGTKLDEEWAQFFREHSFLVGISIDGPQEIHDTFRVTRGGRGSFDQVMRGLGHLRVADAEYNVLTTVHAANEARGREMHRFMRDDCGARFMQFIPIIERVTEAADDGTVPWSSWRARPLYVQDGAVTTGRSVSPEGYGRFLIDVFEEWVRNDVARVYVQMFDTALANWAGEPPACAFTARRADSCSHSSTPATSTPAITSSSRATCSAISTTVTSSTSSLPSSSNSSGATSATRSRATAANATCASPATAAAPKDRFTTTADGEPGLNYLCPSFKRFLHHVREPIRTMAELLAEDRAPAEIMNIHSTGDGQRGRNDPCPCGVAASGSTATVTLLELRLRRTAVSLCDSP